MPLKLPWNDVVLTSDPDIAHLEHKVEGLEAQIRRMSSSQSLSGPDELPDAGVVELLDRQDTTWPALSQISSTTSLPRRDSHAVERVRQSMLVERGEELVEVLPSPREHGAGRGDSASIYRGRTTGLEIIRNLRHLCDSFVDLSIYPGGDSIVEISDALDTAPPSEVPSGVSRANFCFSSTASVHMWIDLAFEQAFCLWPFIDREALNAYVETLFGRETADQASADQDRLSLVHAVIALGQRHDPSLIEQDGNRAQSQETRG